MSQNQVDKKFDCLEFKQKAQEEIYQDIKNLSQTQQIEYFRQRVESSRLGEWWQSLKNAKGRDFNQARTTTDLEERQY